MTEDRKRIGPYIANDSQLISAVKRTIPMPKGAAQPKAEAREVATKQSVRTAKKG
jgi:hypothetical protein